MSAVLVSTKGQVVIPISVRKALGLKPGMRVDIRIQGKAALITPAPPGSRAKLSDIQAAIDYSGRRVAVKHMRVTDYKG